MSDFNFISIPPRGISPISPSSSESGQAQKVSEEGASFQDQLRKALGQLSQDADRVANSSAPSYDEMQGIMEQAKNAFSDSMQAHQMMQNLMTNLQPNSTNANPEEEGVS